MPYVLTCPTCANNNTVAAWTNGIVCMKCGQLIPNLNHHEPSYQACSVTGKKIERKTISIADILRPEVVGAVISKMKPQWKGMKRP